MTVVDAPTVLRVPTPARAFGPATARHMLRALSVYAAAWVAGLLLDLPGLLLPGGGQLAAGQPLAAALVLLGTVLAVFVWWFAGPVVLPPLVWIGAAALAPGDTPAGVLAAGPALLAVAYLVHRVRHRAHLRTNAAVNARLAERPFVIPERTNAAATESSDEDLARLRYALDLALQPLDAFAGFTKIDQYREAATRYQLNALGYALSMAQFTRTPAFRGYLAEAQRNAILKMLDKRVWSYWARENAWGNLRWDPDPVGNRENIMLTGYLGLMVGMYEALNDDRFSQPGSLTFRWSDDRAYPNDFSTLADSVHRNMDGSAFTLFPCEPNWIYAVCNTFGINTLAAHDHLHGTVHVDAIGARLRDAYDREFTRPDGRIIGVRSRHLGLSWNFWAGDAVQVATAYWMHPALPELAHRTWRLLRERAFDVRDGELVFRSYPTAKLDPGNYTLKQDTFARVATLMAAREVGDTEHADAAAASLAREPAAAAGGAQRWEGASTLTNLYGLLGRFGRHSALRDLVVFGAERGGPVLEDAAYPDVLVARAVSDGHALDLTLVPGDGAVRTTLGLAELVPHGRYTTSDGDALVADAHGRADVTIDLDRRRSLSVFPA